jgi:CubicO group peptidase (beta-lactamase class C family)
MGGDLQTLDGELRAFVEEQREQLHVPGVAVGVIHGDSEWYGGFGVTNADAPSPVDEATLFQIGSNTKTYVATAVMREVEAGRIDVDAPLLDYLPEFELAEEGVAAQVTVRHLLTHTGGWDGDWLVVHPQGGRNDDALARAVEAMPQVPLQTPPGSLFHYNNTGFSLAGRVLEVVRGQAFEAAMRELLFEPIGLEHSVFFADEAITYRAAAGHIVRDETPEVAKLWELPRCSFPAGAIACDIRDLLRWGRFQLDGGVTASGERLLSEASIGALHSPQVSIGDAAEAVGLSWMLGRVDGARTITHSGGTNGQVSLHTVYPEHDTAIGIVTNANAGGVLAREVSRWLERRLLGLEHRDPEPVDAGDALDEYAGSYEREMVRLEVTRDGDRLLAVSTPLARPEDWEAGPPIPPVRLGVLEDRDAFVVLDGAGAGGRGRFIRGDDDAIEWLRWGGRVHRRQ